MGLSVGLGLMKLGILRSGTDQVTVDAITLFVTLLCACIVIGHLFEESRWFNESIVSLIIGLCTGAIILVTSGGKSSRILEFDEQLFFIYLLPPIIFNAGFQMKKKQFFRNFVTIMMFGAVGTLVSFTVIAYGASQIFKEMDVGFLEMGDYLAIGAILSATDSVCTLQVLNQDETPLLYSLVFGEGVVNDATSVVLFNAIQRFDLSNMKSGLALEFIGNLSSLFITSTLLGVSIGLLSAFIIGKLYFGRHSTDREVALMVLMAYLSYIMAELYDLSGILTVFFCGIVMSHYTWHNVTERSRVTTKHGFATMSFIAEIFIFVYVGMDALDIEKWRFVSKSPGKSIGLSSALLGLVLVGRATFVFPLSFFINLTKKHDIEKIGFGQQVTIWWAGLMRGAVSMALAYNKFTRSGHTQLPGNAIMITSTITVVLFSTLVFGMVTKPLISLLQLSSKPGSSMNMPCSEPSSPNSFKLPLLSGHENEPGLDGGQNSAADDTPAPGSLRMLLSTPSHTVHWFWRKFDNAVMRPVFGGRGFVPRAAAAAASASPEECGRLDLLR
ncbi:sodium/hydrogen exchanger 1-like [Diospyros lotus]|uniref:sodium/hydrogen exchanger 1-like n=1 Tax=Diospyros lotus TaxID=55363 RepID=UPI0022536426|nr:sodium/hydrogen exchanger 1-like [Diospyros lotus]XP_052185590.1 sodium/hydrogen exchanger 1-like [Diospyros lotus]XP_052185591.1 sodium/hydrogen exchanger 1-like [Diospyros lotus]XP_052185592.1 sodium/hydrogen exchanger 1-like [Diospyros lotus]